MAVQKTVILRNGLIVENAYIRIGTISGTKDAMMAVLHSYISQNAFFEGKDFLEETYYRFKPAVDDTSLNFIKQGYDFIKSLEEFSGAIDVLENGQVV